MTYRVFETHIVEMLHVSSDEFVPIPLRAARHDGEPVVEVGPYSLTAGDAWLMAQSLLILAEVAQPGYQAEPTTDPIQFLREWRLWQDVEEARHDGTA